MAVAAGLAAAWRARWAGKVGPVLLLVASLALLAAEAQRARATLRNWADSLTLCRHMEKIAPDAPAVQNQLGVLLAERSEYDEALGHLRRATVLVPEYGVAHYNLGFVLAQLGSIRESIPHLQKAAKLLPDDPDAASVLGTSLYRAGRLDEAEAELRRALRLDPDHLQALDQLGGVLIVRGRVAEGVEQIRHAAALAPTDAVLRFRLASSLGLLGGHASEEARHLREAMRLKPVWAEPFNALAWMRATSPDAADRDSAEALSCARRAIELTEEKDPKVFDTMAAALAEARRFDEAVAWEQRALTGGALEPGLVRDFRARLELYKRRIAYREPLRTLAPPGAP
jgi:Flp pilus assembly protein TadD